MDMPSCLRELQLRWQGSVPENGRRAGGISGEMAPCAPVLNNRRWLTPACGRNQSWGIATLVPVRPSGKKQSNAPGAHVHRFRARGI